MYCESVSESNDPRDFRYRYDALVREVYDGDTMYADVDLGLDSWRHGVGLRLHGINTPELRKPTKEAGYAARDFVCAAITGLPVESVSAFSKNGRRLVLPAPVPVFLHSHGDDDGKYGRLLSTVWFYDDAGELVSLNELLLTHGHATVPHYS
jgi:endonuclease YncB( thermonuclease family)